MEADYGIRIQKEGMLTVPSNNAYNFSKGNFTITVLFQTTQPGTIVSRKPAEGGAGNGGWWLNLAANGVIQMNTDDGSNYYRVVSEPTIALDGTWHSVAAVRQNGNIFIFFDGIFISVTPQGQGSTPLNISNSHRVVIGYCDQQQLRFVGILEDLSVWNRALSQAEIKRTMFNKVTSEDPGLVGFWEMNRDFHDTSPTKNSATPVGPVSWVPVFHCVWAETVNAYSYCGIDLHENVVTDYGAKIDNGGMVTIPSNSAYNFGTEDFTITAIFQTTQPGTIISRKPAEGGAGNRGWWLNLAANGVIQMNTDDGSNYYRVVSEPTIALDGKWHSVAAVRQNGNIFIFFDGIFISVTPQGQGSTPLNISNSHRVIIGYCDQQQLQFVGILEDLSVWNRALDAADIQRTRFNEITPSDTGLVGFWKMDQNFDDASPTRNNGSASGSVQFVKVAHQAERQQTLKIESGTGYLYGVVTDKSKSDASFPENALVKVFRPDGTQLNQESNTDELFVHMNGDSVWAFAVKNPQAGDWKFAVECLTSVPMLLSIQTTPTQDVPQTIGNALQELYGEVPAAHTRVFLVRGKREALALFSWSWSDIGKWAGITLAAVAGVVAVGAIAAGAALMSPVVLGASAAVAVGSWITNTALVNQVSSGSYQVADKMGLGKPTFGGTAQGSFNFIIDGRAYFPVLRDLLLAVQAGHYSASGITIPPQPTFENLIKGISSAGKKAYVLLWDTNPIQHMIENNDVLKFHMRNWLYGRDARRNAETFAALKNLPNVETSLQVYHAYRWWKPALPAGYGSVQFLNSQHQKIVVVSVNNVKCALVGGFNIITPSYFDDPDHPMYDKPNNFHAWHDCAVLLQGPIVDIVEQEFDRRWIQTATNAAVLNQGTYAKVACWQINHDSCLDEYQVCSKDKPLPSQILYQDLATSGPQYPIDVLITNSEFSDAVTQVKDKLLAQIQAAQDYIYFENFTFHDVSLVRAIINKLRSASENFRCIILIPHPTKGNDHEDQLGQFYLSRMAFAAMLLSTHEWTETEADFKHAIKLKRDHLQSWKVTIPDDKPIEYATFDYSLSSGGGSKSLPIKDVINVVPTDNSRLIFTSPARYFNSLNPNEEKFQLPGLNKNFRSIYVHSKVALFDDNYALVGSANFNARSLNWDGECSVGVADSTKAREIRQQLFQHWGVDTPQRWQTAMANFANSPSERVGVVPLRINTLKATPPDWKWDYITTVVDRSDLL
jgi:phosphatidylserine/phosphatidylglycerophosphate/cardiolipin synthase-like enzyme